MPARSITATLLAISLAAACTGADAQSYGIALGANTGTGDNGTLFGAREFDVSFYELGFLFDSSRTGRRTHHRLLLSLAGGGAEGFPVTGPDIPERVEYTGALASYSVRFVLMPTGTAFWAGPTLWIGPSLYAGYFTFEDQDGAAQGDGALLGVGPTLGLDVPLGAATLTVELGYRYSEQFVSAARANQYFDQYSAEGPVVRTGVLFGD